MHTYTPIHTHPTFSKKQNKIFPRKHFQKLSFYLLLSHRASAKGVLSDPHPLQAWQRLGPQHTHGWDPWADSKGFLGLPRAMGCASPSRRLGDSILAPNLLPSGDPRTVPMGPGPGHSLSHLQGHTAGCPQPCHPPPVHPGSSPWQRPGHGEPWCPQALWPPLHLLR